MDMLLNVSEPRFHRIAYRICFYCKNIVFETSGTYDDIEKYGCLADTDDEGLYNNIHNRGEGKNCADFESSGLTAYPAILASLIERNPKCEKIKPDEKATEDSWNFTNKALGFISEAQKFRMPYRDQEDNPFKSKIAKVNRF
ncbi:MAG: hypothetical protein ABIF08_03075 [Nanoarchaeota archaeon]